MGFEVTLLVPLFLCSSTRLLHKIVKVQPAAVTQASMSLRMQQTRRRRTSLHEVKARGRRRSSLLASSAIFKPAPPALVKPGPPTLVCEMARDCSEDLSSPKFEAAAAVTEEPQRKLAATKRMPPTPSCSSASRRSNRGGTSSVVSSSSATSSKRRRTWAFGQRSRKA